MEAIEWIDALGDPPEPGLYEPPARFRVDGVEFECATGRGQSTPNHFVILKDYGLVRDYAEILRSFRGGSIIEVGIASGGSVALMSLLAAPERLVAIELSDERVEALDRLLAARGLSDRVKPFYGIDQADRQRLESLVTSEFDDQIDLIIDDASHRLEETRITFEALFPFLRPGGLYVIEDWNHDHIASRLIADALSDPSRAAEVESTIVDRFNRGEVVEQPLSRLILEFVLAQAESEGVLAGVEVDHRFVRVRKGPRSLSPKEFRLRDQYANDLGLFADPS